ncbi:MAG: glycoside hydrolase family 31 protein [Planctomycetota bacterium]
MTTGPRKNPFHHFGRLTPLDTSRLPDRARLATRTTGPVAHTCRIETFSCVTAEGRTAPQPSLVLRHAPKYDFLESSPRRARVRFEFDGAHVRAQVAFEEGVTYLGLGERAGPLARNGRLHLLWNTDAYGYGEDAEALYQSHPWVLALHADGRATGVLFDSIRRGRIGCADDGVEAVFEEEPFDVHLIEGAHPLEVLRALAALIGTTPRPPRWALGYHQCRYSYMSADEAREVAARLRAERIPCDALWFDIDYMDRYRVFSWNRARFPHPRGLTDALRADGLRSVAIIDPGVVDAHDDPVHAEGLAGDHFVLRPDGVPAGGRVWPGFCHFPDFTRAETRAWWAARTEEFVRDSGLDGVWCDMNEPALLGAPTRTLREDAVHRGEPSGAHARVHNLYGHLMVEAVRAGAEAARPGERPFVLTRAGHMRTAALAATWTGDNQAHWTDLEYAIPMVLNLGVSGQPMVGPDLGGFMGDPDEELFVRWFELGAYLPFCRGHAEAGTCRKEPWAFGERARDEVRAALERRMQLLPTLVTLFDEAHRTGAPVARPVSFADPSDPALARIDDAFLLGPDLLISPALRPGAAHKRTVLPRGGWYPFPAGGIHLQTREVVVAAPRGTTPVFARAGSIVFTGAALQHTGAPDEERTWHVFLDDAGDATGTLVEDSGTRPEPEGRLQVEAQRAGDVVELRAAIEGAPPSHRTRIVVHAGALSVEATLASTPRGLTRLTLITGQSSG